MNKRRPLNVDDAYALETPEDSLRLYRDWAEDYDSMFVQSSGYVAYRRVADLFLQQEKTIDGPVLDVGCGTGVVGECLRLGGVGTIDGIDISPEMLAECGKKKDHDNKRVYRNLIAADLTETLAIPDNEYAGLVSAGTFTHGHLGPESLDELWRIAAPGARCAIGVRDTHYAATDFAGKLAADVDDGIISPPSLIKANMYSAQAGIKEHADDEAWIVVCEVR